jgi:hypothetical protein
MRRRRCRHSPEYHWPFAGRPERYADDSRFFGKPFETTTMIAELRALIG